MKKYIFIALTLATIILIGLIWHIRKEPDMAANPLEDVNIEELLSSVFNIHISEGTVITDVKSEEELLDFEYDGKTTAKTITATLLIPEDDVSQTLEHAQWIEMDVTEGLLKRYGLSASEVERCLVWFDSAQDPHTGVWVDTREHFLLLTVPEEGVARAFLRCHNYDWK
ncbi:hypothetical protein LJC34_02570 [Oscillospiraceae bacterium OttesenSCG-928-G22]|nr:hypothetical protein [Oscillospiraceae bacterium OttesenSCG-928-G22]